MSTGYQHLIKFHEDDTGTPVFDSFTRTAFNHTASFTVATQSAQKEDFTGSPNDAFVVKVNYPSGSEPNLATVTPAVLLQTAKDAVNNKYGNGEAGTPT